jgi:hypothetical protein
MTSYTTRDLQEEFLNVIRTSQETVVEAVKTCVDTVKTVTPRVPAVRVPLAARLPKPQDVVTSAYDFAEKLLSNQRQFAEELVKATAPLMASNGTPEGSPESASPETTQESAQKSTRKATRKEPDPAAE